MTRNFILFAVFFLISLGGCKSKEEQSGAEKKSKLKVGLVFDVGGRGDKSFNDASFKGLEQAKAELGIDFEYIEPPGEGADREAALRQLASQPEIGLVFGVGFIFTNDIIDVAKEYPEKKFACIDFSYNPEITIPENLSGITFQEERGSILVGAIAALVSKTGKIGFVGGMESPIIKKFERGYTRGAQYVKPEIDIEVGYVGLTASAFKNPAKAKELALGQYNKGVDIIYQASGASGLGVFEAARVEKKYVIGTDQNQENEVPGYVVTSMVKAVDQSVFKTIKATLDGTFKGGLMNVFGIKTNDTDYIYNENNKVFITEEVHSKVESLRKKILSGEIPVGE